MFLLLGILAGFIIPFQTCINTNLRINKQSTILSVLISFSIGLIGSTLLVLIVNQPIFSSLPYLVSHPFYSIIGGMLGVSFVVGAIFVYQQLGATQTAILPVLGQLFSGLIIDQFGLFNAPQSPITLSKILGTSLVLLGVIGVILGGQSTQKKIKQSKNTVIIQLLGIALGAFSTVQTVLYSHIGTLMGSAYQSTFLSFIVGVITLIIIAFIKKEPFHHIMTKPSPWWTYLGGVIGLTFVLSTVLITPIITTGMTVVTTLLGLMIGSLIIDTYGLLGTTKKPVTIKQLISLVILIIGVCIAQFL